MNTIAENDFKKLEDKIDKLSDKIDKLSDMITQLTIVQVELKSEIKGLDKRLDGVEIFIRIVGGGIIVGLLLALSKYLFFSGLV
jgi:hypothetical protein